MSDIKKTDLDVLLQDKNYINNLEKEYKTIKTNPAKKLISLIIKKTSTISIGILSFLLNNERCGINIEIEGFKTILKDRLKRSEDYIDKNYSVDELSSIVNIMSDLYDNLCRPSTASSMGGFYKQKVVKVIRKY